MKTPLETRGSRANDGKSARLGKKQPDGTHAHRIAHPAMRPPVVSCAGLRRHPVAGRPAVLAVPAAGAITDLTPFLAPAGPPVDGGTLASRTVPRMRAAEPPTLAGPPALAGPLVLAEPPMVAGPPVPTASEAGSDTGGRTVVRSV